MEQAALHKIKQLQQRYIGYQLLADVFLATACATIFGSILFHWQGGQAFWWATLVFLLVGGILVAARQPWKTTITTMCRYLNFAYPELEESCTLLVKPANDLNLLERLQLHKVEQAVAHLPAQPPLIIQRLKKSGLWLVVAIALSAVIVFISQRWPSVVNSFKATPSEIAAKNLPPEKVLPQISSVSLKIMPPAYTGKPARSQDKFTIDAEEGALVNWTIRTNIAVKKVVLIFNNGEKIPLQGNQSTEWKGSRVNTKPGFYQVSVNGKLSDLYQVQVIKDAIPVIHIKLPKQYTHIDAGEAPRVTVNASIIDDYGISNAQIFATVAKGSGESVKFKDTTFSFGTSFNQHSKQYNLQRIINLPKLGLEPGDELYFYLQAQDTHQQKSRTDVLIVSIQDTAQLLSMDGIVSAANIKPEYFRSQRQIILDTEKLLKEKDSIAITAFKNRCNDLGTDQKMLRLRYGKFLGEEDESGTEGEDNEDVAKAENFGNAAVIMDAYTDKHDNAEDATFLEPAVKAQLKATLNEMWKAELRLRLFKPQEALPYEYKALRLLKDLQQKSRSFVAKTSYNPPPLKPEKRLSGDLSKIGSPINQQTLKPAADKFETLKRAITILQQSRYSVINAGDKRVLQLASQQLALEASSQPGTYLRAVSALRRVINSNTTPSATDRATVEKAIQQSLPNSKATPSTNTSVADMGLAQRYYKNLNR